MQNDAQSAGPSSCSEPDESATDSDDSSEPDEEPECANAALCQSTRPEGWLTCINCDMAGWGRLEVEPVAGHAECAVCLDPMTSRVHFPTRCGHWFCVPCSRTLLFGNDSHRHVSPCLFGCPPCVHVQRHGAPVSCKARPCCYEDDSIVDEWRELHPDEAEFWDLAEEEAIEREATRPDLGRCPLCRAVYASRFWGHATTASGPGSA